ncbi:hypothetical protein [Ammoniphilus oxalaticus]|uniref:hypothetical protein n=1 Tax=Ammoniphilus oxalaticus TaxID=66863 RepID=UPI0011C48E3F|nr:hypothetical protein [Ammoniphilus oxalaticus]
MHCQHCRRRRHRSVYKNISCVIRDGNRYFAILVDDKLFRRDEVVIKRISKERYEAYRHRGVPRCRIV